MNRGLLVLFSVFLPSITNLINVAQSETIILGIESSCDDTSVAVLKNETILSNVTAGQKVHQDYGGVVPELASRAHMQNIVPVVDAAIKRAGIELNDINAIAFTKGPGLLGSLLVGTSFAKSLALSLDIPLVDVNHMHGHILAHFIDDGERTKPSFPFICLTISGGHTQIVLVKDYLEMEVVGSTIDDAAGEAFDKAAKMLGFPYPGGPLIDKAAQLGDPDKFEFAKPNVSDLNYSFSGLKTSILYFLQKMEKEDSNFIEKNRNDLCASIQKTITEILFKKLKKAVKQYNITEVAIAGGVSANSGVRNGLLELSKKYSWNVYIPRFEYCTDNAAMIAITGKHLLEKGIVADQSVSAQARMPFNR
jgi:N6-L-threonylcarbamoyladenine synthase